MSWSLWRPARLAVSQREGSPHRWLPSTQCGHWQCFLQDTKLGPDQSSNATQKSTGLGPMSPPTCSPTQGCGVNPAEEALVPSYRRQRRGSPPQQAPSIVRKKPRGLHSAFNMWEGKQGPKQASLLWAAMHPAAHTGELPEHSQTCQKPLFIRLSCGWGQQQMSQATREC